MKIIKNIIEVGIFSFFGIFFVFGNFTYAESGDIATKLKSGCFYRDFTITSYYSPLPKQDFYVKGNFKEDVVLNGEGKYGASGKKVFNGMIAAPKTYPFGTKIYFSGVGLGIVEDRGGAIVHSGERGQSQDRLDFWAGHGTTGLIKAVNFGKQTFKGLVCPPKAKELKTKKIGLNLDIFPLRKYFFDLSFWHLQLGTGRSDPRVYAMQRYLVKLKFLKSEYHNGKFDQNTAKALCNYQIKRKIVSKGNQRCGTFGPITSQTLRWEVSIKNLFPKGLMATGTMSDLIKGAGDSTAKTQDFASHNTSNLSIKNPPYANMPAKNRTGLLSTLPKDFKFNNPYKKNQIDKNIIYLQYILKKHDCYSGNLTKTYSKKVIEGVSCYQLKHKLLTPEEVKNNVGGFLGPKTRDKLNEFLNG